MALSMALFRRAQVGAGSETHMGVRHTDRRRFSHVEIEIEGEVEFNLCSLSETAIGFDT
jgi:hypothetical protein